MMPDSGRYGENQRDHLTPYSGPKLRGRGAEVRGSNTFRIGAVVLSRGSARQISQEVSASGLHLLWQKFPNI
jgi:hypothetical protein